MDTKASTAFEDETPDGHPRANLDPATRSRRDEGAEERGWVDLRLLGEVGCADHAGGELGLDGAGALAVDELHGQVETTLHRDAGVGCSAEGSSSATSSAPHAR